MLFWKARRSFPRETESAVKQRWGKNTAGRWHKRRGGRVAAEQFPSVLEEPGIPTGLPCTYVYSCPHTRTQFWLAQNLDLHRTFRNVTKALSRWVSV